MKVCRSAQVKEYETMPELETPLYCIVGKLPVKSSTDPQTGDLLIHAYNWEDGTFDLNMLYLDRLYLSNQDETTFVTKKEFDKYVRSLELRRRLRRIRRLLRRMLSPLVFPALIV